MIKQLSFTPYNEIWLDCIQNNLLGILLTQGNDYIELPHWISSRYFMTPSKFSDPIAFDEWHRDAGLSVIQLEHRLPDNRDLERYFDIVKVKVHADDILAEIKNKIDERYYIFVEIDRFYLKKIHKFQNNNSFIHPTFIYGYDFVNQKLNIAEDELDLVECFELDFQTFLESLPQDKVELYGYRNNHNTVDFEYSRQTLLANLHWRLNTEVKETEYTKNFHGIETIHLFSQVDHDIVPKTEFRLELNKYKLSQPWLLQKRNIAATRYFVEKGFINNDQGNDLLCGYTELEKLWLLYRDKMYIHYERNSRGLTIKDHHSENIGQILKKIYQIEFELLNGLINHLS